MRKNMRSIITRKLHKYSTGTDTRRFLCHQFSPSSLLRLAHCVSRSNTCWLKMKHMTSALFQL